MSVITSTLAKKKKRSKFARRNRQRKFNKSKKKKDSRHRVHHLTESRNKFVIHSHNTLEVQIENNQEEEEDCFTCKPKLDQSYRPVLNNGFNDSPFDNNEVILDSHLNHFFAFNLTHFKVYRQYTEHTPSLKTLQGKNKFAARNEARFFYKEIQTIPSEISMRVKKNWNKKNILKSVRIDNSGIKSYDDILAVFYFKNLFMFKIKRSKMDYSIDNYSDQIDRSQPFDKYKFHLELVYHDLLKISSKSIKLLAGRDNNLVAVTKNNLIKIYSFENQQHLKLLKTIRRNFFFPDYKRSKSKTGKKGAKKFQIIDLQFAEPLFEEKQKRLRFDFCEQSQPKNAEELQEENGEENQDENQENASSLNEIDNSESDSVSSATQKCLNIRNNMLAIVLIEPYNSQDKWIMNVSLQHMLSYNKISDHKMQYPTNESLFKQLIFGNFRILLIKDVNGLSVRYAGIKKKISQRGEKTQLLFGRRIFKIVFLFFMVDGKIRMLKFVIKLNIDTLDSPQDLRAKDVYFFQHDFDVPSNFLVLVVFINYQHSFMKL